jgi:AcrR family transcriptional regulator
MEASPSTTDRRADILSAALECFNAKGFAGATVEDVRRRSGASVGSIYHWFGSKEEIAAALYVEALADYQLEFHELLRGHTDAERGIKALARHHLRWVAANTERARFLLQRREAEVLLASEARVRELNRELLAATAAWLEPHVKAGRVRRLPLDLHYTILIGPSQEYARHWLQGRMKSSIERAQRELGEAAWRALAGNQGEADGKHLR